MIIKMKAEEKGSHLGLSNTEMPLDHDGRTMHLGVNRNESIFLEIF